MRTSSLCMFVAVTALALPAGAEGESAEQLFNEGRAALDRGDYATACPKLAESLRKSGEGGPRLSLAECEERRGHLTLALEMFEEAARVLPPGSVQGATASDRVRVLERRVPVLTVDLGASARADVALQLDGKAMAKRTTRADPGDHTLVATAAGCAEAKVTIRLVEGDKKQVPLSLACGPAAAAAGDTSSVEAGSTRRTVAFVLGGIGIAGAVVFGVTGGMALSKQSVVNDECQPTCTKKGLAAASDGKTIDIVNAIAFGAGAIGLGVGTILIVTAPKSPAPVGLHVVPSSKGVGVTLSGPLAF